MKRPHTYQYVATLSRPLFLFFEKRIYQVAVVVMLLAGSAASGFDEHVDDIMYQDPAFPDITTEPEFSKKLKPVWLKALNRPEAELRRMAAETIVHARNAGMTGLDDATTELLAVFKQESLEPTVRRAIVNALVTIDAASVANELAANLENEPIGTAQLIEPALARWDYKPARQLWRQRLEDPETERSRILMAIKSLGIVGDTESEATLVELVKDGNAEAPIRLAAARAVSNIESGDDVKTAQAMLSRTSSTTIETILAATLLSTATDETAIKLLRQLTDHESTSVVYLALQGLHNADPKLVYEYSALATESADVNVRRLVCETLVHKADIDAIVQLGPVLRDPNPYLRRYVTKSLLTIAEDTNRKLAVMDVASDMISQDNWRGIEQGLVLVGMLDHEATFPRLIELLQHRRPEVSSTAAWSLRKIAVKEALPGMFAQAERKTQVAADVSFTPEEYAALDMQLRQLFQAFGKMGYHKAEPLMRRYIPKLQLLYTSEARAAAVWAIGKLNEGKVDEALAVQLVKRLADTGSQEPETEPVRIMCAVAIGRMNAMSQLPAMRKFGSEAPGKAGLACVWAIEQMTGEVFEFELQHKSGVSGWFLQPNSGLKTTDEEQ